MLQAAEEVASLPWVRALRPTRPPYPGRLSTHSPLEVWHVDVEFEEWPIPPDLARRWTDKAANVASTWRKRPLVVGTDSGCRYSCGEVELAARLRNAGYQAFWISEWSGFPHLECWEAFCVKRSEMQARVPTLWEFDHGLRTANSGRALDAVGGHPDVGAWQEGGPGFVYIEYKGPEDEVKPKQNLWAGTVLSQESSRLPYVAVKGSMRGRSS